MLYFFMALLVWNAIVYTVYAVDKRKAINGAWRIPEKVLLSISFVFGALGATLAMQTLRHKTRKPLFYWVYVFLIVNAVAVFAFWYYIFRFI